MTAPANYDFYDCKVWETRSENLLDVEPAGTADGDEIEIVRWGSPKCRRHVAFVVASRGGPPEVPAGQSLAGQYVLVDSAVGSAFPMPTLAQSTLWIVYGRYEYAMRKSRKVDADFPLGKLPVPVDKLGALALLNGVPAVQFLKGLLDNRQL